MFLLSESIHQSGFGCEPVVTEFVRWPWSSGADLERLASVRQVPGSSDFAVKDFSVDTTGEMRGESQFDDGSIVSRTSNP
jgi:hypothetical protein